MICQKNIAERFGKFFTASRVDKILALAERKHEVQQFISLVGTVSTADVDREFTAITAFTETACSYWASDCN